MTIPSNIREVTSKALITTTPCSATCGLGHKTEKRCIVRTSGRYTDCSINVVYCVISWMCGINTFTLTIGEYFSANCKVKQHETFGDKKLYYTWKVARGIVTSDDKMFRILRTMNDSVIFPAIKEADAGTYRCDVQTAFDLKEVKRLYFGIKVVSALMVDLNFEKYLISRQKLEAMGDTLPGNRNITEEEPPSFGTRGYIVVGVGCSLGILGGVGIGLLLLRTYSFKGEVYEDTED
ncbi:transmembrane protein 81 [Discoglossus pictus]